MEFPAQRDDFAKDRVLSHIFIPRDRVLSPPEPFERGPLGTAPALLCDESPSLTLDNDSDSICSDKCSEKTCSDCCGDDKCDEDCSKECDGFVDCDDTKACSKLDCIEDVCRDTAPPCFNSGCLQTLTVGEIAAATNLVTSSLPPQPPMLMDINQSYSNLLEHGDSNRDLSFRFQRDGIIDRPSIQYHSSNTIYGSVGHSSLAHMDCFHPPSKRIKAHDPHAQLPSSCHETTQRRQPSPHLEIDQAALLHCHWGSNCDEEFFDWSALDDHIYRTHVKPQKDFQCRWDNCEQPTDSEMILSHVKRNHPFDEAQREHICLWFGCSSRFCDGEDLEYHVQHAHVPSNNLYCQWDQCGVLTQDPNDLSLHLQMDHVAIPPPVSSFGHCNTSQSSALLSAPETTLRTCEWVDSATRDTGRVCGRSFTNADELQQHTKEAHIGGLRRKTGYVCQWADCSRKGIQPFSQRGKLERHMQVHTGCRPSLREHI
ncbi:hypothetical protein FGG08_001677 [Glutinoglossum americanum]|uniref:C2H2-type domain-containing protein n=1 Tax=Glutinoglossum americanum TaxID=1670608 RepID=A0A9P8IAR8_9PEZI|nr:hypothetical protein FGG08_001677 [Glutinoglossum americanum]